MGRTWATGVLVYVVASVIGFRCAGVQGLSGGCQGQFSCTFAAQNSATTVTAKPATSAKLRTALLFGNVGAATEIMMSESSWKALSDGFKHSKRQKSFNRNLDPDVIVFKAIANAAIKGGEFMRIKLAEAIVDSITPREGFPVGVTREGLKSAFLRSLRNQSMMTRITIADANTDSVRKRKLLCAGCTPTSSSVCSFCWPGTSCTSAFWCT